MRGNPFIRLVVAFVVFLLLGVPVWRLTEGESVVAHAAQVSSDLSGSKKAVQVRWDYTGMPNHISVQAADGSKVECTPEIDGECDEMLRPILSIDLPKEGADFVVTASWNSAVLKNQSLKQTLKISLQADGFAPVEKTFWSDEHGKINDVISLVP